MRHEGQGELDLGFDFEEPVFAVRSSSAGRLWWVLDRAWAGLGFDQVVGDSVFRSLVLARVVEPVSKLDSIRVLRDLGVGAPSYSTVRRRLRRCVEEGWRDRLEAACLDHARGADLRLCLYDVTTLHFETHQGDGFREPGFSKDRRLEPQITVGLLATAGGFPLVVNAFEGNKAETKTMLPVLRSFAAASGACGITVVADAGMMSQANLNALSDAGFGWVVGHPIPAEPFVVAQWRAAHPGRAIPDGKVFCQPVETGTKTKPRWAVIYYQYRTKRARRDIKGLDKTLAKARRAVAGLEPVKKNRFVQVTGGQITINEPLAADAYARAGLRAYITDQPYRGAKAPKHARLGGDEPTRAKELRRLRRAANTTITAYHQLWHVEAAFRMSKHDLQARPIFARLQDSIDAHLTIVFAALAIGHWIETTTGTSLRRVLHELRPIRRSHIEIAGHTITAEDPLSDQAKTIINTIHQATRPH
jgi:hypothetical protein